MQLPRLGGEGDVAAWLLLLLLLCKREPAVCVHTWSLLNSSGGRLCV